MYHILPEKIYSQPYVKQSPGGKQESGCLRQVCLVHVDFYTFAFQVIREILAYFVR